MRYDRSNRLIVSCSPPILERPIMNRHGPDADVSPRASRKRVAVVAGTPFDTRLGCSMLEAMGIGCEGFPLAATPDEQSALQYFRPDLLQERLHGIATNLPVDA